MEDTARSTWWTPASERMCDALRVQRSATVSCALDPERVRTAVAHRARDLRGIESLLDELLAQLALRREPQEQPDERAERHERALDHHHHAGEVLVPHGADSPLRLRVHVPRI